MDLVYNNAVVLKVLTREARNPEYPSVGDTRVAVLEWVETLEAPRSHVVSLEELSNYTPPLRIIFPTLSRNGVRVTNGLLWLVRQYGIPTAFLEGELRSVTHAFGSLDTNDGYRVCWFNYLAKNVTTADVTDSEPLISDPTPGHLNKRYGDHTWKRSGYFLRWPIDLKPNPHITLICFGGHTVMPRLQRLTYSAVKEGVIHDPLSMFVVILHELASQLDHDVWTLSRAFAKIEFKALQMDTERESFTALHNLSKHIIYLQESSEAILKTTKNLAACHEDLSPNISDEEQAAGRVTRRTLTQVQAEIETLAVRLRTLDRRMQNVIALSFHLVTQEGNAVLQNDSQTMATIAFVTLIFLPISTVSTIFGTQFFNTTPDNTAVEMSKDFWVFWAISIPLTLAVLLGWSLFSRKQSLVEKRSSWVASVRSFTGQHGRRWQISGVGAANAHSDEVEKTEI
ncbi:hypothetical protein BDW75DRAFT_217716 [Aspergillus navahoensis]